MTTRYTTLSVGTINDNNKTIDFLNMGALISARQSYYVSRVKPV